MKNGTVANSQKVKNSSLLSKFLNDKNQEFAVISETCQQVGFRHSDNYSAHSI